MRILVNDKMQKWYQYELVEPEGLNFDPDFHPELTPIQMLEMGVFEGKYMTDCQNEFPPYWFAKARLSPDRPDVNCNYFAVKSRQPLSVWRQKGWIIGPDVRGWFQWYCRYFYGRRIPDVDKIQISRWRAFKRHKAQIVKNCLPYEENCRKKQRQALLQWAYNPIF